MARMTGWEAVVTGLRAEGVPYVFGLPGDPGHLYDALYEAEPDGGPRAIGVRYETSGAFLAMAYARVSGQVAACFGCPGPGIANLVPGILEAFSGCTPMLVLGVRASRLTNGMGAFQECDHIGMLRSITKWATTVETAERIPWTIRRAVQLARSGQPGPVYVELPADIGKDKAEIPPYVRSLPPSRPAPDPAAIAEAANLLAAAERPLLVTGGGAILSDAGDAVAAFSHRFGVPIQTTPAGRGSVAETHPLFAGLVGLYRTTFPRETYEGADLLLTVGARMEEFQGGFLPRPEGAKLVQIDIDPFELGRNWRPDVAIQADARRAVEALGAVMAERGAGPSPDWVATIERGRAEAIEAARADAAAALADGLPFKGKSVVAAINRVFGANTILVKENGGQDLWAYYWPYYQVLDEGCCVPPAEQTAMGYGVIGAMAAKLARPDRQVVCTTGDGAFQMAIHELGTAAQEKLPVTWVVLDDGAFGWVQWSQKRGLDGRIVATQFDPPLDVVGVARACGCDGVRVETVEGLEAALEQAKAANAAGVPFVVDVPVDQAHHHAEFDRFQGFAPEPDAARA
jgi:acetolactate synthase-1/2/3 large subunit